MIRTRSLVSGFLSLSAAAALTLSVAGGATAAPAAPENQKDRSLASAVLDGAGAAEYWTEERMRNAISGDVLAAKAMERGNRTNLSTPEKGKEKKLKQAKAKSTIALREAAPVEHVGKVFISLSSGDYVCSGNAVSSPNGSTVATAAHCLTDAPGVKPTKFVFVPAYENDPTNRVEWVGTSYHVPQEWNATGSMKYDTGFVVVNRNKDGQTLTDVVGGSTPLFEGFPDGLPYKAFGYPSSKPFDGQTLWSCSGTASPDTTNTGFGTQGIPCDMTGGSSGGPWLVQGSDPLTAGYQVSVISYGYKGGDTMYGPNWGPEIAAAYTNASLAPALAPAL